MPVYECLDCKSVNVVKLILAEIINEKLVSILFTLSQEAVTTIHCTTGRSGIEFIIYQINFCNSGFSSLSGASILFSSRMPISEAGCVCCRLFVSQLMRAQTLSPVYPVLLHSCRALEWCSGQQTKWKECIHQDWGICHGVHAGMYNCLSLTHLSDCCQALKIHISIDFSQQMERPVSWYCAKKLLQNSWAFPSTLKQQPCFAHGILDLSSQARQWTVDGPPNQQECLGKTHRCLFSWGVCGFFS